jgi:mono/diheme cytochrome c family protein
VKLTIYLCLVTSLLLPGCAKQAKPMPLLTAKAYGTQIVEQSGGKQVAGVGAKLTDPIVVQVNGADGNPVVGAFVTFRGEGLGFNVAQSLTDESGQASTVAQLGSIPGNYVIIAESPKAGGGILSVSLREIALGYQEKVGKQISDKFCVMCHDPESTPERVSNFDNLVPPQPHLFSDGNAMNLLSDSDLTRIIADGGPALGKSAQTPAYRGTLTASEIKSVVAYIRAISDPPYPAISMPSNGLMSPK